MNNLYKTNFIKIKGKKNNLCIILIDFIDWLCKINCFTIACVFNYEIFLQNIPHKKSNMEKRSVGNIELNELTYKTGLL